MGEFSYFSLWQDVTGPSTGCWVVTVLSLSTQGDILLTIPGTVGVPGKYKGCNSKSGVQAVGFKWEES